jgi:hypothetical protein
MKTLRFHLKTSTNKLRQAETFLKSKPELKQTVLAPQPWVFRVIWFLLEYAKIPKFWTFSC